MRVNRAEFKRRVDAYLDSDEGRKLIDHNCMPLWLAVIFSVVMAALGAFLLLTIRGMVMGGKFIGNAFSLRMYFEAQGRDFQKRPEDVVGLLLANVIVGPVENGENHRFSLMVGAQDDVPADVLCEMAEEFGNYYFEKRHPRGTAGEEQLEMLKNDQFSEGRRRAVPEPFNRGFDLWFFDLNFNLNDAAPGRRPMAAVIATTGESGSVLQIPSSVATDAIHVDEEDVLAAVRSVIGKPDDIVEDVFEED